ncbi:MAG: hypothetical protein CMP76_08020 [Flavobacterium sp.]|uniref:hypothetical protein n=1 Tax=Flavobacterium sp. TaxID=239 RepID=UPI000C56DE7E|nr:hypothetical protein [Flavobacterium sp.]MBF03227.1 hypothetical protein [Flavobacterium sp.]|tara:strand:- start:380 stop:568 length:189 start_codon:yes stop_codon:yes gene_type:complete
MPKEISIVINDNPVDAKAKEKALQQIATLKTDVVTFLGELASNPKAVDKLMSNKTIIKSMFL